MTYVKTALLWLWLLAKRLYRRPAFLVLLVLIPTLVLGYTAVNTEDSGMLTVAVVQEGHATPEAPLMEALRSESHLLLYRPFATAEEAKEQVAGGKADTAWIFPNDIEQAVRTFVQTSGKTPFIRVLVREDSVMLRLARERLSGSTFPTIARQVYLSFVRQLAPELDSLTDAALLEHYDQVEMADRLFTFDEGYTKLAQTHYLFTPLRGLLGSVILLCALAAAMYHLRDLQNGTFCRLGLRWRWTAELAGQIVATIHVAAAAALCLSLAGLSDGVLYEVALAVLYSLCCAAFAMALRRLINSLRGLAALLPTLVVLMLVLCPVFFDLSTSRTIQLLFPLSYYVYAANQPVYLLHMLAYTLMCFGVYALAGLLGRKENR